MERNTCPNAVLIIGAGMASIKCAHSLIKGNPNIKITIIEANNYIGGRMCKAQFANETIEMGANWVHGLGWKKVNPIW